jgi:hypothetical protein
MLVSPLNPPTLIELRLLIRNWQWSKLCLHVYPSTSKGTKTWNV